MNGTIIRSGWAVWFTLLAATVFTTTPARANCDGMDGPVVKAAQEALVEGNVNLAHAVEGLHGGGECDACKHEHQGKHGDGDHGVSQGLPKETIRIDGKTTVRELVGRYPRTRPVFEEHGIDYCCGGGRSLVDVARKHDLELPVLVAALEKALRAPPKTSKPIDKDWYAVSLQELVNHIVSVHHAYLKKELPRLRSLEKKVLNAHGAKHGEMLRQVHALFMELDTDLSDHLIQEEKVVFPRIVAAETRVREKAPKRVASVASIHDPIGQLAQEHDNAGQLLAKLREVTDDYTLPPDSCPTFKALYDGLQQMEADLHQHIHLENNVLFPRALDLERRQRTAKQGGQLPFSRWQPSPDKGGPRAHRSRV